MSLLEIWLLGIALAMDCFTVSIAAGITSRKIIIAPMLTMALAFGFFQGGMTFLGFWGASFFTDFIKSFDHWIAFALLAYLGGRMIWDRMHDEDEKSMNLLDYKNIPTMAIATSIDALAVGISFACIGDMTIGKVMMTVLVIGFCSFAFTILGQGIGIYVGKKFNWPVEIAGGIILILIGIKILIEHLTEA